jgi:TonB-linked SusC/RagA family outer membrane protein
VKNAALEEVLTILRKQSGYNFLYNVEMLAEAKPITLTAKNKPLQDVLKACFAGQPLSYIISKNNVVIKRKPVTPASTEQAVISTVTGTVSDDKGLPLPGVSVLEKGTTNGVTTNIDGHYTLKVAGPDAVLVFSMLSYNSQETKVGNQTSISIQLIARASDLNEVVVVGYGTQKKVSLTGSVSSITGAQVATTRNESVINMLAGKLPGVRVVQNTAEPGAFNNSFDIRGYGGSPLIVIDGVPRSGIERIDPNDIESVSVLKDAAAAVYGVQAANGVILVTTKKGKAGTSQITYTATVGIQREHGAQTALDAIGYMTLLNEKTKHNISNPNTIIYQPADFAAYANGTKTSTNWFDETFRRSALQSQQNLSASGGSEKMTYFMSLGYLNQGGFYKSNDENYHKYNLRSNLTAKITKGLSANLQLSYISDTRNAPSQDASNLLNSVYRNPPIFSPYAGDPGNHLNYFGDHGVNAVAYSQTDVVGYRLYNQKLIQGNFDITYDIPFVSGLKAKALYSYNNTLNDNKTFNKEFDLYQPVTNPNGTTAYNIQQNNIPSSVLRAYNTAPTTLLQYSLSYNHTFNKVHNIEALALYEEGTAQSDGFTAQKYIAISTLDQLAAGGLLNQSIGGDYPSSSATRSMVGKLHYDYAGKYLVDFSGRRDGSSRFAPSHQFGFFPAASAAWRISEEGFFKNTKALAFVDNLKIRASYGLVGDASAVSYQFISGYDYPGTGGSSFTRPPGYVFDGSYVNDVGFRVLPNPDIFWTKSKALNFGLDAEFWQGLLGISADYFRRQRSGILGNRLRSVPGTLGASLPQENINSDQTSGVELELTHKNKIGKLHYELSGNVSYARTMVIHSERAVAGNSYDNWMNNTNGRYNDVWFGYGNGGQFTSFNDIYHSTVDYGGGNRSAVPGDYRYIDWNGDGVISQNNTPGQSDLYPIAATYNGANTSSPPLINFGLTMALQYQNFDMNVLLQGAADKWIAYNDASLVPLQFNDNAFAYFQDRWHPADPTANQFDPHTVYVPGFYSISGSNPNVNSAYNIQNASYVRLKSLELGYTLPINLTKKIGMQRARVYLNGFNLFTITGVRNYDPEHPNSDRSNDYPLSKTYNIGVNVTF